MKILSRKNYPSWKDTPPPSIMASASTSPYFDLVTEGGRGQYHFRVELTKQFFLTYTQLLPLPLTNTYLLLSLWVILPSQKLLMVPSFGNAVTSRYCNQNQIISPFRASYHNMKVSPITQRSTHTNF